MNSPEIYYFSATGNSFAVARDIAETLGAKMIPVKSTIDQKSIRTDADMIGLVYPIYDFKQPSIISDFIKKIEDIENKYIFAAGTYGFMPLKAIKQIESEIKAAGGQLSAGICIAMPHNGIGSALVTKKEKEKLLLSWQKKRVGFCRIVLDRGQYIDSKKHINVRKFIRTFPTLFRFMIRTMTKGIESLAFTQDDKCDGCGICEKVCPINNIKLTNGMPVWQIEDCIGCFACVHWCPRQSVNLGGFNGNIRCYHHPDVALADIIAEEQAKNV